MLAGFQPLELESSSLLPKGGSAPRSCEPEDLQHDKVGGVQVRCSGRTRPRAQQVAAAATPPPPLVPACRHLRGLGDALHSIPHALPPPAGHCGVPGLPRLAAPPAAVCAAVRGHRRCTVCRVPLVATPARRPHPGALPARPGRLGGGDGALGRVPTQKRRVGRCTELHELLQAGAARHKAEAAGKHRWSSTAPPDFVLCPAPAAAPQLADKQQDLVRVQRSASFNSINIQASASVHAHSHVLCEDESPLAPRLPDTAPLKGGDGYDRLLEYRCGRYLFHHAQGTFLPVPPLPADFAAALAAVAGSRNIKGARGCGVHAWG